VNWIDITNWNLVHTSVSSFYNLSALTPVTSLYMPTDGSLAANTCIDGIIGPWIRCKYITAGNYSGGTSLAVYVEANVHWATTKIGSLMPLSQSGLTVGSPTIPTPAVSQN
jgi:hypothetical protein